MIDLSLISREQIAPQFLEDIAIFLEDGGSRESSSSIPRPTLSWKIHHAYMPFIVLFQSPIAGLSRKKSLS